MDALSIDILVAAVLPAILLTQAATLLGRAHEIDLSLDQQCYFVAVVQSCLLDFVPDGLVAALSGVGLFVVLALRFAFGRRFGTNSMIVSIAVGMMLVGVAFVLIWFLKPGSQYPTYRAWIPLPYLAAVSVCVCLLIMLGDLVFSSSHRVKVPVRSIGSLPPGAGALAFAIAPASLLTMLAGSLLAVHAQTITLSFSNSFGILGATVSLVAFGRLSRATALGLFLAAIYVIGILVLTPLRNSMLQSFGVPILSLVVVGLFALFYNRS